jgi:hypothetical protein
MLGSSLRAILPFVETRSYLYLEVSRTTNITVSLKLRQEHAFDALQSGSELQISLGPPLQNSHEPSLVELQKLPNIS